MNKGWENDRTVAQNLNRTVSSSFNAGDVESKSTLSTLKGTSFIVWTSCNISGNDVIFSANDIRLFWIPLPGIPRCASTRKNCTVWLPLENVPTNFECYRSTVLRALIVIPTCISHWLHPRNIITIFWVVQNQMAVAMLDDRTVYQ